MKYFTSKFSRGFTLIELLVVIAILGILAGSILVAINPFEQLAKSRDAGRKTTINQLGHAVESYYSAQNTTYPTQGTQWMTTGTTGGLTGLQAAGELKNLPVAATPACTNAVVAQNGYCFETDGTNAIIYVPGESTGEKARAGCTSSQSVWIVWASALGKTGSTCTATAGTYPSISGVTDLK